MVTDYLALKEVIKFNNSILGELAIHELRYRFIPKPNMSSRDYYEHVDTLIQQSTDNWTTKWYDKYQYWVQGIFY